MQGAERPSTNQLARLQHTGSAPQALFERRKEAKLLQQAEHVLFGPLFHNLAAHNAVDVCAGHGRFLLRRRDPLKYSDVLEARGLTIYHEVTLGDEEVRLRRRVDSKGCPVAGKQLFERLAAAHWSRDTRDRADVVRAMHVIDDGPVSVVARLTPAPNDLFVVFGGHGLFLLHEG